uniref:Uncharacterized protein n=1 Tax=Aegilops tauschii subsp. strangulata TaxID=200361 RepID=A0A453G3K8_AEGTS
MEPLLPRVQLAKRILLILLLLFPCPSHPNPSRSSPSPLPTMAAVQICILSSSSRTASRWWAPHLLPSQDSGVLADVLPASSPSQDPAVARQERKPVVGILPPSPLRLRIKLSAVHARACPRTFGSTPSSHCTKSKDMNDLPPACGLAYDMTYNGVEALVSLLKSEEAV